jgi:hypothetical protein
MTTYSSAAFADEDFGIDLGGVPESDSYALIPVGDYPMQCIGVELKTTNNGGSRIAAKFEVTEGEFAGRKVFENFNIKHSNPQTVEIALKGIKQWVRACGGEGNERLTMGLLAGLEGKEFIGTLKVEKDKTGQYGDQNRIKSYAPYAGPAPRRASAPVPPPAARAPAPAAARQPWER